MDIFFENDRYDPIYASKKRTEPQYAIYRNFQVPKSMQNLRKTFSDNEPYNRSLSSDYPDLERRSLECRLKTASINEGRNERESERRVNTPASTDYGKIQRVEDTREENDAEVQS